MNLNLSNRILTSLILLIILFFCLFINKFLWLYLLVVASILSFNEFNNLIKKIYKTKKNKIYFFNIVSSIYLASFSLIAYNYQNTDSFGLLFILFICVFSDTGGFVVGKLVGGKKLTKISPNKTISGTIGSFLFSIIPGIFILFMFNDIIDFNDNVVLIFKCLFLSLICQLGDLLISYFKRKAKVKDTGSILPGHGGLLDRIDGFIFVLPVAFLLDRLIF